MNWDAITAVAEVLGVIGVIVSLVFVGYQIRKNTIASEAATYQASVGYDIAANDVSARQFAVNQMQPYLARNGFPGTDCPDGRLVCAEPSPVPHEYVELASDAEFRALLMLRRGWLRAAVRDHTNAANQADEILTLIRKRLEVVGDQVARRTGKGVRTRRSSWLWEYLCL